MTKNGIRLLLLIQGVSFIAAAMVHFGILAGGFEHQKAGTAETVIGLVLLGGFVLSLVRPPWTRIAALSVQTFALLGTLVGLFTIAIGVGPRTIPDLIYHACILTLLIAGLVLTARSRKAQDNVSESAGP